MSTLEISPTTWASLYYTGAATWAEARDAAAGTGGSVDGALTSITASLDGTFSINRTFANFDTSTIPSTATITGVKLYVHGGSTIQNSPVAVPVLHTGGDTLAGADYDLVGSEEIGVRQAMSNAYIPIPISPKVINRSGTTYLGLLEAHDFDNDEPAAVHNAVLEITTSGKEMYLEIEYSEQTLNADAGFLVGYANNQNWDTTHDAATGTQAATSSIVIVEAYHSSTPNQCAIYRGFLAFDTTHVGSYTVTAAKLRVWPLAQMEGAVELVVVAHTGGLTPDTSDYDNIGSTAFSADTAMTAEQYNDIVLNASGLAAIDGSGYTYLALLEAHDFNDVDPTTGNDFYAPIDNTTNKIELLITTDVNTIITLKTMDNLATLST